ncbi:hypothetical protein [Pseudomonas sp. PA27(2017)]|nr:hypothetical protein [Pseudomonas sp. PA27(2017)]
MNLEISGRRRSAGKRGAISPHLRHTPRMGHDEKHGNVLPFAGVDKR